MLNRIARATMITVMVPPLLWLGSRYVQGPPSASAEVFRELADSLLATHGVADESEETTTWRRSRFNEQEVFYRVQTSEGSLSDVLDAFEARALPSPTLLQQAVESGQRKDCTTLPPLPNQLVFPVFRYEWPGMGISALGILSSAETSNDSNGASLRDAVIVPPGHDHSANGLLVTVAVSGSDSSRTTALTWWIDQAVDLRALVSSADTDAPGKDPGSVPRYPGLRRHYTVEEQGAQANSMVALYAGSGSITTVRNFYREQMAALGWETHELSSTHSHVAVDQPVSLFMQERKECLIAITSDDERKEVHVMVTYREW